MILQKLNRIKTLAVGLSFFWLIGCGVKGDPLPPERPPDLGRGRPTYKRATEGLKIEKNSTKNIDSENREDEEGENE